MKSKKEIQARLDEVLSDERISYKDADVFSNAPLALIQVALKNQRDVLKWVLSEK